MTRVRRQLLAMAALALVAPAALPAQQLQVALGEAVRRALEVQPAVVQARGDVRTASAGERAAWGAFLPTLTTVSSAARGNVGRTDGTTGLPVPAEYTYTIGLSASLDLFNGFRREATQRTAAATSDAADAGYVNQRYQTILATQQLFYNASADEDLVRVAEAQLTRAQQQLRVVTDKLRAGSATRSDSLRAAVDVGNARLALLQAQANLATAQANLGRQIGVEAAVRAAPDTVLPALPDTAGLRAEALARAPQVRQAEAQAKATRAQVWASRAQYWPTLSVSYNDNRQGTGSPFQNFSSYRETFNWRFGLAWTLFNGFTREANQVSASVLRDVAEARAADLRRQTNAQLTQQLAALYTGFTKMDISRATVAAATEDVRVQQERYRVGVATILDLLTSQASLTQAEVSLVQARFDYLLARAQLEALVGRSL
jgi:outer membrane protein